MNGYTVIDNRKIEPHISFIRIEPTDIKLTLGDIFRSLSDLSWINNFDKEYIRDAFLIRSHFDNFIGNLIAGLTAYSFLDAKPSIKIQRFLPNKGISYVELTLYYVKYPRSIRFHKTN